MSMIAQADPFASIDIARDLFVFSPMIALIVTMLAVVIVPMIAGRGPRPVAATSALGVLVAFILTLRVLSAVGSGGVSGLATDATAGVLLADNIAVGFQLLLFIFLAGVMWLWWMGSADAERNAPEFFILLLGSALGMMLMVSTANLLMIVVAIEMASLPSYAIVGFDKKDRRGAEASLKYMVFGAVSAAIMLYGVSMLYGLVGSLNVADVARYTVGHLALGPSGLLLGLSLLCLLGGIAFKISAVPFHFWCPDAFQGAKTEVTTWLSVASKAAGLILLTRLVTMFSAAVPVPIEMSALRPLAWAIGIMASITCTVANFAAYRQTSVKRLLAYSSIAHAGYMMMAAAVFLFPGGVDPYPGMTALFVYIIIYLFMNLGAFGVTALVEWDTGSDELDSFTGLIRRAPGLAVPMVICLMSLVGLPPLAGFLGKWWILVALGNTGTAVGSADHVLGWILIVIAVVNTLISLYFYMRVVVQMTLRDSGRTQVTPPFGGVLLVNGCALLLLLLFFAAAPLKSTAMRLTRNLYQPVAPTLDQEQTELASTGTQRSAP